MSASSKKKLRKEQEAAKLTEKQLSAQKEAKKVNFYTAAFVAVMVVLLVVAISVGVVQTISNSGIREKNTVAVTVGEHEISNAEMNYFFTDSVNNFYSNYGSYATLFGLDLTKPLDEQVIDEATGLTWADDFLTSAKNSAQAVYAMVDAANAAGFTLTEAETATIQNNINNMDLYAAMSGYADGETYLKAIYGTGATMESYQKYIEMSTLASAYYNHYSDSLTFENADLRAAEAENYDAYSSYTYNTYYIPASKFLTGTTDAEGNTTYTEEETAASVAAAEAAAKSLAEQEILSVDDFNAAIAALSFSEGTEAESTPYTDYLYNAISSTYSEWLTDDARTEGDINYFAQSTVTTDEAGNEVTIVNGYYVVYYVGRNENTFALPNVRHILVAFAGGSTDENTGATVYSDEEKATAKAAAEELLAQWKSGAATEESFAELSNLKSDDGDGTSGGLYENVYPGQMVANFNDWCFDESRAAGDTGIVETEYGYHVMFYSGDSSYTYRDYLIENELRSAEANEWYTSTIEALTITDGNTAYVNTGLVLSRG